MIIAIVLVISVCFVFVGCPAKNPDNPNNPDNKPCTSHVDSNKDGKCDVCGATVKPNTQTKDPSEADLGVAEIIRSYTEAWLLNNAENHDANKVSTLVGSYPDRYAEILSSVKVDPVKDSSGAVVAYKLKYAFKDKTSLEQTINVVSANNGNYAGQAFLGANKVTDSDHALGAIINGVFKTIKTAVENGEAFNENGFGFDATAYFDFYYGEMAQKLTYGLRVAGQIGIEAKDTFAGIEVLHGNDVIGGLYYEGAENKADCKLYLNAGDYKYYIDNADINSIVMYVIEAIQGIIGGGDAEEINPALETPFYNTTIETLSQLLPSDIAGLVGPILSGVINEVNTTQVANGTQYQVKLDLSALLDSVKGLLSTLDLSSIIATLPDPLNQLDLGSFQGVGGTILISAVVNDNGLGGLELSYNAPKQDFRFSYADNQPKVYGPINVALGIKDFELGAQNIVDVIPSEVNGYDYFSPLNAELNVNVAVNGVEYEANIVSDINPFAVENGVITFVVNKENAEWLNGRLEIVSPDEDENGWNGLVAVEVEGQIYKFYTGEFATTLGEIAKDTFMQVMTSNNVFTPIIDYVLDLIAQFAPEGSEVNAPAGETESEEGGFNISAITGAFGIVDAAKELIATWENDGVLVYKLDGEALLDNYFQVKLSQKEYNAVVALINQYLAPIIGTEIEPFTADAAQVLVSANYGDHEKQVYVSVEYKDTTVIVLLDGSKWESDKTIALTVDVNNDHYALVLDASNEKVYNLTYTAKDVKYVDITLDLNENTIAATLVANEKTHQFNGALKLIENGVTIDLDLDNVITSWTGKNAYGEVTGATSFGVPTVKFGAEFGWTLPNNETNVKVDVELVSWGQAVVLANNAELMSADATADISVVLQELADAFLTAIAVNPAE